MTSPALEQMWNSSSFGTRLATIEELRVELTSEGIECPGVLVIGAQSAGKSSVLERLTGISFPRAENTCTRVPTIVQLQTDAKVDSPHAFVSRDARFCNAVECKDMPDIQQAILDQTQVSVVDSDPIKDDPIHIKYVRRQGPLMTLIDLPGITHVDAQNDDFDIHDVTSSMVHKYTNNANMIVLVVIPANDDFGNSEALRIAQRYDDKGMRTIGVISKCDMVPENSDIVQKIQMFRDNDVKLALGFIAVRNKGPGEESVDIQSSESELFRAHPLLKQLRPHERGYHSLSKKIVELQSKRVDMFIPEARKLVCNKLKELRQKLLSLGHHPSSDSDRREVLAKEICALDAFLARAIRGGHSKTPSNNISARCHDLSLKFADRIKSVVPDWLSEKVEKKLSRAMKEATGHTLANFLNHAVFRDMFCGVFFTVDGKENFDILDGIVGESTETLIEDTFVLMNEAVGYFLDRRPAHSQFPKLSGALKEEFTEILRKGQLRATEVVKDVILAERNQTFTQNSAYMGTMHSTNEAIMCLNIDLRIQEYVKGNYHKPRYPDTAGHTKLIKDNSAKRFVEKHGSNTASTKTAEEKCVMELQLSLHSYADVVMRRLFDVIPMVVFSSLVWEVQPALHYTMQCAFNDEHLRELFVEDFSVRCEREKLEGRLKRMIESEAKLKALR